MFGTLMNMTASQPTETNLIQKFKPPVLTPSPQNLLFEDPFWKLVYLSMMETEYELLLALANEAANITGDYEEVVQRPVSQLSIRSLTGLFNIKETCIKKFENSLKNKLQFLDHSESDSFGKVRIKL